MLCPVYDHELTPLSCPPPRGSVFVRLRGQLYFRLTSSVTRATFRVETPSRTMTAMVVKRDCSLRE